jgi:hypothetical protein
MRSSPDPLAVPAAMRPRLRCALGILLEAFDYAAESRRDPWDFAVEMGDLRAAGVRTAALRLLVCKGFVQHAVEKTKSGAKQRVFGKFGELRFPDNTCFILTEAGARVARLLLAEVPFYDHERRELRARGQLIKRFMHQAPDQHTILSSFQELGWPSHIDDPLSPKHTGQDAKLRLRDAINRLNRHQENKLVHFRGDGTGRGILWEFAEG